MTQISAAADPTPLTLVARPAAGGIRTHIMQLLEKIDRTRYSVTLAAPVDFLSSMPASSMPPFTGARLDITAVPRLSDFRASWELARLASSPDAIVHAHGIRAGFVATVAKRLGGRFTLIVTYHNVPPGSLLARKTLGFIASECAAQIAVSQAIAAARPARPIIDVIPNGIDLAQFGPADRAEARRQLGLAENDRPVVGAVARLSPEKGIDVLLAAARLTPEVEYVVAGSGPEEARLRMTAPKNARLLGYIADARAVYAAADVIVVPSRMEGQGIVALEAMASGAPVIASKVGGLSETIRDGVNGVLFGAGEADALATAVRELLRNDFKRNALVVEALQWVRANADAERRVAQVEDVYRRVSERPGNQRKP